MVLLFTRFTVRLRSVTIIVSSFRPFRPFRPVFPMVEDLSELLFSVRNGENNGEDLALLVS